MAAEALEEPGYEYELLTTALLPLVILLGHFAVEGLQLGCKDAEKPTHNWARRLAEFRAGNSLPRQAAYFMASCDTVYAREVTPPNAPPNPTRRFGPPQKRKAKGRAL